MQKIIYIMECGCNLTKGQCVSREHSNGPGKIMVCPEHDKGIAKRQKSCIDCGEIYDLPSRGSGGKRCKICAQKEIDRCRQGKNKGLVENRHKQKADGWSIDPRGDYCMCLYSCKAEGELHCGDCDKFIPIFRGVDPAVLGDYANI